MNVPDWHLRGHVILACNCDYGCPCNFNGLPTTGKCEGNWNWHIEDGRYGDVPLSGLAFSVAVNWPGAIHEGGGEALVVLDERADDAQRQALGTLLSGQAGGPWKIIATTIAAVHGPVFAPIEVSVAGLASRVRAGEYVTLDLEPVRNKVTGVAVHPRAILPEGFVFKEGDLGASSTFRVSGPVSFDHTGRYAAAAPFAYQGP
ncbi:DUF1326 domain-containing protein [Roseisolibacter sp. H3M3-2]|uniref:DUF1326 domain-containing protein n=1 Tax=Roseisolibacter sp. H3M3-2 TaxID=3031323 RepID=UPI0023D9BC0D|nr:DUF1326 domain-containing protein [Roseisolibacter sp. H3M3-2]MDF1505499.1 DUF1326 domain-containing protein [Roseisolibacter sp. H3M3-2]